MKCQPTPGFYNKWLRSQSDMHPELRNKLNISTLSLQELQSVLDQILNFEKHTRCGKVNVECHGLINITVKESEDSGS